MRRPVSALTAQAVMAVAAAIAVAAPGAASPLAEGDESPHWPQFRGPSAQGVSDGHALVDAFDVETGENIRWRTPIPGLAHSSPIVWGEKLFVTTAVRTDGDADLRVGLYGDIAPVEDEGEHDFRVYCLDKRSGDVLWERTAVTAVPKIKRHPKGSHAASSPATDGERVVALFASEGLYCYDLEGNLKWSRDLGPMDSGFYMVPDAQWGYSASPILHDGKVIVQCDIQAGSFLAVLDGETGADVWRVERDELPTWSTPTVDVRAGRAQVICNGYKHIGGYDLATGAALWSLSGGGDIPVPTPVVWEDLVFITSAHGPMAPIYAIRVDAEGTLDLAEPDDRFAWLQRTRGNYMQTPIVYDGLLYCCRDNGALHCYDPRTGEQQYAQRLGSGRTGFTGSGVAGDGKLYFTAEAGEVHVVHAGETFGLHDVSELGEECMATPAISEGVIYFRSRRHVTAVGAPPAP